MLPSVHFLGKAMPQSRRKGWATDTQDSQERPWHGTYTTWDRFRVPFGWIAPQKDIDLPPKGPFEATPQQPEEEPGTSAEVPPPPPPQLPPAPPKYKRKLFTRKDRDAFEAGLLEDEEVSVQELVERRRAKSQAAQDRPRKLGRSVYDALQTHGHFGLVDGGETYAGNVRRIVVHVPKRSRGYALDIKQGEIIHANSARGKPVSGVLEVVYVSRHKYTSPGHAVTSCVIGVPEHQWKKFLE